MRIKKKYVIKEARVTEALLIDTLTNLTPMEKKVLRTLHKKYKDKDVWSDLDSYDMIDDLEEKWMIDFGVAYKIVKTYLRNRDELFSENEIVIEPTIQAVLRTHGNRFFKLYRDTLNDESIDGMNLRVGDEEIPYDANFWDSYGGFTIYLPVSFDLKYAGGIVKWGEYVILISTEFNFDKDEIPSIQISYRVGDVENEQKGIILKSTPIELPTEVSKESILKWVDEMVEYTKEQIKPFNFPAPQQKKPDIESEE